MSGSPSTVDHREIRVVARRERWRAVFVHTDGHIRREEGVTHDAERPSDAGASVARAIGLSPDWRLQIIERLESADRTYVAAVPAFELVPAEPVGNTPQVDTVALVDVWVDGIHVGSIHGSNEKGWTAVSVRPLDRRGPFGSGFYPSRTQAAAAVAAGVLNGRRA